MRRPPEILLALVFMALALLGCGGGATERGEQPMSTEVVERSLVVAGGEVHALECGAPASPVVLFLHGARFSSATWRELGTLERCAAAGLRAIAVDLPGYGSSASSDVPAEGWLLQLFDALELETAVVVSPSMSGAFSLPFVLDRPERASGFVPIAPVGLDRYGDRLAELRVPTLVVWGEKDTGFPVARGRELAATIPGAELLVIEGGSHPCYLDEPELFHERLVAFVR